MTGPSQAFRSALAPSTRGMGEPGRPGESSECDGFILLGCVYMAVIFYEYDKKKKKTTT